MMNHLILKIKNINKIKKQLKHYTQNRIMKKPGHKLITCNLTNSTTFDFRMRNHKVFQKCSVRLSKLENILGPFDFFKRTRVLAKQQILNPKVKIHSKIGKMFCKQSYVFIWNIHPRAKEMLIKGRDYGNFHFVKIDLSV